MSCNEIRAYASTALGQVHYRVQGNGLPVLLIHQTPWYAIQFERVMPLLAAAGLRVVAPDTPGFGFSPAPTGAPDLIAYAEAMSAVLDAAQAQSAIVIGHHTGAALAAVLAARHPQRAVGTVLHGLPLYSDTERVAKLAGLAQLSDPPLEADGSHLSRHFTAIRQRIMHDAGSLEGVQMSTLSWLLASDRSIRAYRALFEYADMQTSLLDIRAPTLLLTDKEDSLREATRRASHLQSSFIYRELSGGGSHVIYDRPDEWASAVLEFVDEHCRA